MKGSQEAVENAQMLRQESTGIPILTYHSMDDSGSVISTSPSTFKRQMERLWQRGYRTLSLSEAAELIRQNQQFPAKKFVITFDDGYENVYSEALPVLSRFGFNATVFLITSYCGTWNRWPGQLSTIERRPLLSWSQAGEMVRSGFQVGVHTATHPDLTRIPIEKVEDEIVRAKHEILDKLGLDTDSFAYPYGRFNRRVLELVRRQFVTACSTRLGKVRPRSDTHLLPRVDMYYLSNSRLFDSMSTNAFDRYLSIRQLLRELRQAVA